MKQGYISGLVLLGVLLIQIKVARCINCLNCRNIKDLNNCLTVTACKDNEACYIEKVLSAANFQPLYNVGCRSIQLCTLQYCNKQAYGDGNSLKKRQSGQELTLCSECCFEDSCNTEGCGFVRGHHNNVSQCYSCDGVTANGPPCTNTVECDLTLYSCSITLSPNFDYNLGCKYRRQQCKLLLSLSQDQHDENVKCCDQPLCNKSPYHKINKTAIAKNFTCPTGIARPTSTQSATTTAKPESTTKSLTPITTTTTHVTTPIPTRTTQVTTPIPTTSTAAKSTEPPPKTLPPVTRTCAVCSGPKFLCEKLFAPTPCPPPNNYCINTIQNHKDGTKTVDRACGNFDTCYREWFQGSSDKDVCRRFTGNDEQHLDFQCTFCCTKDNCNIPLHPDINTLYKNTI